VELRSLKGDTAVLPGNQSHAWQFDANDTYVPIAHDGAVVGFCKPSYAAQIVIAMNREDRVRQALYLACYDLVSRAGGHNSQIDDLVQKYLNRTEPPKCGTALIAVLLRHRQAELDLNDDEFTRFCDSYRLSPKELKQIWLGHDIEQKHLGPLARILGQSIDQVIEAWKGSDEEL
jgi:hypothetical protein